MYCSLDISLLSDLILSVSVFDLGVATYTSPSKQRISVLYCNCNSLDYISIKYL